MTTDDKLMKLLEGMSDEAKQQLIEQGQGVQTTDGYLLPLRATGQAGFFVLLQATQHPQASMLEKQEVAISAYQELAELLDDYPATAPALGKFSDAMNAFSESCFAFINQLVQDQNHLLETVAMLPEKQVAWQQQARAFARHESDPKSLAMREIRAEWERRQRPGASFAREMARHYQLQDIDISEGGIKNAIGRWRREE